jgi:MFS family permease
VGLVARYRSFSEPARAFLAGAAALEIGHAFQWALQNLYVTSLGYSVADAGTINAAIAVAVVIATFPSAWLYNKLGPRRSLSIACVITATAFVGFSLSTELWTLVGWAGLSGAGFTLHAVVAAPYLVSVSKSHERTHLFQSEFAVHTAMQSVGLLVSCVLAGVLEESVAGRTVSLRTALLIGGAVSALALVPYRRVPRVAPDDPEDEEEERSPSRVLAILRPRNWHLWVRISLPHMMVGAGAGLSIPFINLYFTERFELPTTWLGPIMAASAATMTIGALFAPRIVERVGLVKATILTEFLSIPFFVVLAFTYSLWFAIAAAVFRAALMNLSQPLWRNLMMEITPREWRPAVNGVSMLCWSLGWALSTHWGGLLIDVSAGWLGTGTDGYAMPMIITIGAYFSAIVLEAMFFWRVRHVGRLSGPVVEGEAAGTEAV